MANYSNSIHEKRLLRIVKRGGEYVVARTPIIKRLYWRFAPRYYRWKLHRSFDHSAPIDLTKIVDVNTDNLNRMTGRYESNIDRGMALGKVKEGDWDQRPRTDTMISGEFFEETILHRSFRDHFVNGLDWMDTDLYDSMMSDPEFQQKMGVSNEGEVLERLHRYEQLYQEIQSTGYKTQKQIQREAGIKPDRVGYLDLLADEITVDIGRDGSLLFVDGNHRLSIAKILDLDTVPVTILVRHSDWLDKRKVLYRQFERNEYTPDHPDVVEFGTESPESDHQRYS